MVGLRQLSPNAFIQSLLPLVQAPVLRPLGLPVFGGLRKPELLPSLRSPVIAIASISSLLGDIWESILRAVPKKKTSHMKKRHRQYAGKALKDVTSLNKCSACGRVKRAHVLCPYCVQSIKKWFNGGFGRSSGGDKAEI